MAKSVYISNLVCEKSIRHVRALGQAREHNRDAFLVTFP